MRPDTIFDEYELSSNSDKVKLNVNVGFGQIAVSTVTLDSTPLKDSHGSDRFVNDFDLELGSGLDMKELKIATRVKDIDNAGNPTNRMFVRYKLVGGKKTKVFDSEIIEAGDGETVLFKISIIFFA